MSYVDIHCPNLKGYLAERDIRLRSAYTPLRRLDADDLPLEFRDDWHAILDELTRYGPERGRDGHVWKNAVEHTTSRIRNRTGRKIAERIYRLRAEFLYYLNKKR